MAKTVRAECESAKVAVRHARRGALEQAKALKEKDAKRDFEKQVRAAACVRCVQELVLPHRLHCSVRLSATNACHGCQRCPMQGFRMRPS